MDKISSSLRQQIKSEPGKSYHVLIVVEDGTDIDNLPLQSSRLLMENIASATLTGNEVLKLSELKEIESIELDEEVHIM